MTHGTCEALKNAVGKETPLNRRTLMKGAVVATALTILKPRLVRGAVTNSKIPIGVVGQGGRGHWISRLFSVHGGYQITAVADYFPEVATAKGQALGVPAAPASRVWRVTSG